MLIKRQGFGQVELNHMSAQRTGQIYAQLPAKDDINILENGQFVKYDYAKGVCDFTGEGEWMMVVNEVKLYDDRWRETYKDFAMKKEDYTPGSDIQHYYGVDSDGNPLPEGIGPFKGQMTPRVFKTNIGDIYTTNMIGQANTSGKTETAGVELVVGDVLSPKAANGILDKTGDGSMEWQVVKTWTMPDGQPGVKLMRIK